MNTEPAEAAVLDLDTTLIGELLTRLPAIAAQLRHGGLVSTLSYIAAGDEEPEVAFIRDVLSRPLAEVIDEWYGGHLNAAALGAALTASAIRDGVRPSSPLAP